MGVGEPRAPKAARPSLGLKIAFGTGDVASGVVGATKVTFLLFYYTQVLGLEPALVGLALGIATLADAITDPLVGALSDRWKSRLGRRHPFMWFSLLPLCVSYYLLLNPADGLSQLHLFLWLTGSAVLTRTFITFFGIPHIAFGAELTDGYAERTKIMSFMAIGGTLGAIVFVMVAYGVLFASTPEYENGLLNPDAYVQLSLLGLGLICFGVLVSTGFTQRAAMRVTYTAPPTRFTLMTVLREGRSAFANYNFRVLIIATVAFGILMGSGAAMHIHMVTYFWGFLPAQMVWLSVGTIIGSVAVFGLAQSRIAEYEKKNVLIALTAFAAFEPVVVISLRLLGWFPENGTLLLIVLIICSYGLFTSASAAKGMVMRSMLADIVDEHALVTGQRQEGIFYSVSLFCSKATGAVGSAVGGLVLSWLAFPANVDATGVPPEIMTKMGIFMGPGIGLFYIVPVLLYTRYRLDRRRLDDIQRQLNSV